MAFTSSKDTDFKILMELPDRELGLFCQTSSKINSLCRDENFWRNRILIRLSRNLISSEKLHKLKDFLEFKTWKEFYIYLPDLHAVFYKLELYSFGEYEIDKINNVPLPEYIDREKFLKYLKRKIFEETFDEEDNILVFNDYAIQDDVRRDITKIFEYF